jgi:uncharacterized oxidoreductase
VKHAKAARPGEETLVPGEPEQRMRAQRLAQGVPLSRETWLSIVETARGVGIDAQPVPSPLAG